MAGKNSTKGSLGTGIAFPFGTDGTGSLETSSDEENIRQTIHIILATTKGERIGWPEFGCNLRDLIFEPNSYVTAARIEYEVKTALINFEERIKDIKVKATEDPVQSNRMNVDITYVIKKTNVTSGMVYPFYLNKSEE